MVRLLRWTLAAIAFALAGYWTRQAIARRRPYLGIDPVTGLELRIAPLTRDEWRAAIAREADPASAVRV